MYACMHTYIHACMHAYIHTHIHVGIELFWGISCVFTVWYICTRVACGFRYTLSTVRRLNDRHHNFACTFLHIEKYS